MMQRLKTLFRDSLPPPLQVPLKYWYSAARGELEPEMALLPALVYRGSRVADIGANRGTYAYRLHQLGARLDVFEPNPVCASVLAHWARHATGVAVHQVALSSQGGSRQLHIPVDAGGVEHEASASLERAGEPSTRDVEVPVRTLDSFGFSDLAFVKIDVEGHEAAVIAGARKTLIAAKPALLIEIEQRHNLVRPISDIFNSVEQLGYHGFFLLNGRLVPIAAFDPNHHQTAVAFAGGRDPYCNNFLFLPGDRLDAGQYGALVRWLDE